MNDNISLSSTIPTTKSNEKFVNSLNTTSDKIGSHFTNLNNRSEEIDNIKNRSASVVQQIADREADVARYAQQLVEFKTQFENDKKEFESQLRNQQESIENIIVEVSQKFAETQTISVDRVNKLNKYKQEKSEIMQKIDDMHGMEDDLMKEEKEINDRIANLEQNIKDNDQENAKSQIKKVNEDITATTIIINELQNKIKDVSKKHQQFQNNNQIAKQKVKKIEDKISKEKKSSDVSLLKKSLSVQTEKFKLFDDQRKENEKQFKEISESIQNSKDKMHQTTENKKEYEKNAEHRQNRFDFDKNQIEDAKNERNELDKCIKLMKQCKTMNEYKLLKKILETKGERDEILRKIGEIHVKKKENLKMIPQMNVKLQNYDRKIDDSSKIDELIQEVDSKIKEKEESAESDLKMEEEQFSSAIETLEQINNHIAFSEKVGDELNSHKFIKFTQNYEELKKYAEREIKIQKKLDKMMKENKQLKKKIEKLKAAKKEKKNLINCPKFTHQTNLNANNNYDFVSEKILVPSKETKKEDDKNCSTDKLQSLVYFHQKNIQKRRYDLIERKRRLQNVCDFYNDPKFSSFSLDTIRLCNCMVNLYQGKRIRSYDEIFHKIMIEKEKWKNVAYGTPPMLVSWYNLIDNMF